MSTAEKPREEIGPAHLLSAAVVGLFVVLPLGGVFVAIGWWWISQQEADRRRVVSRTVGAAVVGVALLTVLWDLYWQAWTGTWTAIIGGASTAPLWWCLTTLLLPGAPLGFAAAAPLRWLWITTRHRHPIKGRERREKLEERRRANRADHLRRRRDTPLTSGAVPVIGAFLDGDAPESWRVGDWSLLPDGAAHLVAIGATGSGKTQTILRLIASHLSLGWRVIVIDAKEDHETARRFADLSRTLGVDSNRVKAWPDSGPIDLLRGPADAVSNRLMASAAWTEPYYRAVANTLLTLATEDAAGTPVSFEELLNRLDPAALKSRWAGTPRGPIAAGISATDVQGVRFRYFNIASDLLACRAIAHHGGGWSWEDGDAVWITLPTSTRSATAGILGRALLVDLIGYIRDAQRRTDPRPMLVVIEELGAIVSADRDTANLVIEAVERARSARVRTIVSVQTPEGLGDPASQSRILHGGAAVIAHRMPRPDSIVELAGSRYGLEASLGITRAGNLLDSGSVREQHQFRIPPNRLRSLGVGEAIFVHEGHWAHVSVPMVR